jgi:hypothetical protein
MTFVNARFAIIQRCWSTYTSDRPDFELVLQDIIECSIPAALDRKVSIRKSIKSFKKVPTASMCLSYVSEYVLKPQPRSANHQTVASPESSRSLILASERNLTRSPSLHLRRTLVAVLLSNHRQLLKVCFRPWRLVLKSTR